MDLHTNCFTFQSSRELQIIVTDTGTITFISPNCYDILGFSVNEMLNTNINDYLDIGINNLIIEFKAQTRATKKDKEQIYLDICAKSLTNKYGAGFELSCFNINKYMDIEKKYNSLLGIIENSKDFVFKFQFQPYPKFTYISQSVFNILGFSDEDFYNDPNLVLSLVHPDDFEIQEQKKNKNYDFSKIFQVRFKHKNGRYVWIEDYMIPTFDAAGELISVEGISRDITERKELEQRLERLGYFDDLTRLFNKNYFLKELDLLNTNSNIPIGIIACDLDNLKHVNDSLGYSVGDSLIKSAGTVLNLLFNGEHIISRTGGNEFAVIIKNKSYFEVQEIYTDLQSVLKQYNYNNKNMPLEMSIGVAYSKASLNTMEYIFDTAKNNMYREKKQKKGF